MTTTSSKDHFKALGYDFPEENLREVKKGGARLTYIPVSEVIARMNGALGVDGWRISSSDAWIDSSNPDWVIAKVVVEIFSHDRDCWVPRIGWGGQKIKLSKGDGAPLDLGDEFKGASSDAFKKAVQAFGVGLSLARSEEAIEAELNALAEKASPAQHKLIQEALEGLPEEDKAALLDWWKANLSRQSLKHGTMTLEGFRLASEFLGLENPDEL